MFLSYKGMSPDFSFAVSTILLWQLQIPWSILWPFQFVNVRIKARTTILKEKRIKYLVMAESGTTFFFLGQQKDSMAITLLRPVLRPKEIKTTLSVVSLQIKNLRIEQCFKGVENSVGTKLPENYSNSKCEGRTEPKKAESTIFRLVGHSNRTLRSHVARTKIVDPPYFKTHLPGAYPIAKE